LADDFSVSAGTIKRNLNSFGMEFDGGFWAYPINNEQAYMTNSSQLPTSTASYNYPPSFVGNLSVSTSSALSQISTIQ
jgi:hypothetical protein